EIADSNIVYNIREYYGTESDLDGNERVNFVITPWVNRLSLTSTDEDDFEVLVEAYSDALVDLNERDEDLNPLSDEQEVIYLFAPDPNGFANPYATRTVDDLAGIGLLHSLARHYYELVSYNQRVLEKETDAEEPWLVDVLGTVAADLIGFGAAIYGDAWDYMDAPHLFPLVYTDDEGILIRENRGAQWLFGRWLVDVYGTDVVRDLTQTEDSGTTNVRAVTATEFEHVVARWQVALLTTRETDENGDDLVDLADYPPYENSTQGDATYFYGAENYQMGVDIDGVNKYLEGGATESPSEVTDLRVRLGHTDHYTLVPGVDLYGYVEGGYAAQVVRLVGAPYDTTVASIRSEAAGLGGVVIRWNDPETLDYAVEDVFSATDPTNVAFPEFPSTEEPQYGVGEISEAGTTTLLDEDGDETVKYVYDTDRWLLDLTSRDADYDVELAIWLDRRYSDDVGGMSLTDPWLAVVEAEYVPAPTVDDIQRGECDAEVDTGETIVDFAFPVSVLEYLYYQEFLAASPVPDDGLTTGEDGGFDACGEGIEEGDTGDTGDTGEAEDTGSDSSYVGTYTGAFEMVVTTTGAYVVSDTCEGTMTLEVDEDDDPQAEGEFECSWTGSTIIGASSGDIEDYYTEISDGTIAGEDMTATVEFWGLTDTMEGTFVSEDEFQGFFVFSGTVEGYDMEFSATFDLLLDEDEDEDEDDEEEEVERTCANDWDMDGVLDEDEPQPDTLMEQVHVMQCTAAGGDGSEVDWVEGSRVDTDSTDEDDDYSFDHKRNLAGRSGVSGEEAYLEVTLPGGAEYLLIVGAGSYAGPYELTIQEL
ncbi:MAG: hypothetical protein QGG40_09600, partial [Myxococcota bacterium]|nr:hypothetical protein [Myxococcota bacterium]